MELFQLLMLSLISFAFGHWVGKQSSYVRAYIEISQRKLRAARRTK